MQAVDFNNLPAFSQLAVQKYEEMFPAFSDSRECKLLKVGFDVILGLNRSSRHIQ